MEIPRCFSVDRLKSPELQTRHRPLIATQVTNYEPAFADPLRSMTIVSFLGLIDWFLTAIRRKLWRVSMM
jgi:hypothetical protein